MEYFDSYNLPSWSLSYLINGDSSGIENDDVKLCDEWVNSFEGEEITISVKDGEPFFTWKPEFGLATDCLECDVYTN